jgi:hypothetical protein
MARAVMKIHVVRDVRHACSISLRVIIPDVLKSPFDSPISEIPLHFFVHFVKAFE